MKDVKLSNVFIGIVIYTCFHIGIVEGIIGGETARNGQFKYQMSLQNSGVHFCGASIISNRHLLTAAHCVIGRNNLFQNSKITAVGGITNLITRLPQAVEVKVEKIYVPKSFQNAESVSQDHQIKNDIAVLRLETELDLGPNSALDKIDLPTLSESYPNYYYESPSICGFGVESIIIEGQEVEYVANNCAKLKYAETMVIPNDKCRKMSKITIYDNHMCAQVKQNNPGIPEGVCVGDSGGGLIYQEKTIIGVLSSAYSDCNEAHFAGIYTRVTSFLPFIHQALQDVGSSNIRTGVYARKTVVKDGLAQEVTKIVEYYSFI